MRIIFQLLTLLTTLLNSLGSTVTLVTDPQQIASQAAEIVLFNLPDGCSAEYAARLNERSLVSYQCAEMNAHLYLVQSAQAADSERLNEIMEDLIPGKSDVNARLSVVETRTVRVNGQEATLALSDGVNSERAAYRQALVQFEGRGGPALLVYSTPLSMWDIGTVEALIASIRLETP